MVELSQIPSEVQNYLKSGVLPPSHIEPSGSLSSKLITRVLEFKRSKVFNEDKKLIFDLNLMDFGEGVIGVNAASDYYFNKPAKDLQVREWKSLINFYRIFSK